MFHGKHVATFGQRVRAARLALLERKGIEMSQVVLANALGLTSQSVSAWESGGTIPAIDVIEQVAKVLGVTPGWLAFGQEPRYPERAGRRVAGTAEARD